MKQVCKVFIILGMVCGFIFIFPIFVGAAALKRLDREVNVAPIHSFAIIVLIFCSLIGGAIMFTLTEKDLADNNVSTSTIKSTEDSLDRLSSLKELVDNGIITQDEYNIKKAEILSKI